jgi:predicted transcriptional regulator
VYGWSSFDPSIIHVDELGSDPNIWRCPMTVNHYGTRIQKHLDRLRWDVVDFSHETLIHITTLKAIMDGSVKPTHDQLMIIINKINKRYPPQDHWRNYVDIVITPIQEVSNDR